MNTAIFPAGIDVVIGVSELFGIRLDENFRQSVFFKINRGILAQMAYYTGNVDEGLHFLSIFHFLKKMLAFGKKAKKIFGKRPVRFCRFVPPIC